MSRSILGPSSVLSAVASENTLNASQISLDHILETASQEASNPLTLAAMMGGGLAYRASNLVFARVAAPLLSESSALTRILAQGTIRALSLGTEITAFRSISQGPSHVFESQGFATDFINFGLLKGTGLLGRGQNPILIHALQASSMVAGHQLAYGVGVATRPEGSLVEQLVHAEITNIELGAGMSLVGTVAPGLSMMERHLDVLNSVASTSPRKSTPFAPVLTRIESEPIPLLRMASETADANGNGFTPNRYHLADSKFFNELGPSLSLRQLAGYARSRRDVSTGGFNFETGLMTPLRGATEYSPYGADLVEATRANPEIGLEMYTGKWEFATVVSPATAILGLGNARINAEFTLEAQAAQIIMAGKAKFLKWAAGVSTFPLCFTYRFTEAEKLSLRGEYDRLVNQEHLQDRDASDRIANMARVIRAERFSTWVEGLAPNFGFINVEDSQGSDVSGILQRLSWLRGSNALWSDDVQGTGVIAAATVRGWLSHSNAKVPGRNWGNMRGIIFGAGAGSMGVYNELINNGAQHGNILVKDSRRVLTAGDPNLGSDPFKVAMSAGIPEGTSLESFMADGIDFVINLGDPKVFTKDATWTEAFFRKMNEAPFVAFLTNPEPGIRPAQMRRVRPDAYYSSGNQTLPSPANNFTAFTHIGAAALMARAGGVGPLMTREASRAISEVAQLGPEANRIDRLPREQREFGQFNLVPHPLDLRLVQAQIAAVAKAAARENLVNRNALQGLGIFLSATPTDLELAAYDRRIDEEVRIRAEEVAYYRELVTREAPRRLQIRFGKRFAPFRLPGAEDNEWDIAPQVDLAEFERYARHMGVQEARWEHFTTSRDELKPEALTEALNHLKENTEGETEQAQTARQELEIITLISHICPALGMSLAVRRGRIHADNLTERPTVFHRENVLDLVRQIVPEAVEEITRNFPTVPRITPE